MEYLRNLYSQSNFSNEELSNIIHSLQVEIVSDSNNEKKNKIISELYQIVSIPTKQIKMAPSRWDELRFNIYLFIASIFPNYKLIPTLNFKTNSAYLFYIISFIHPSNIFSMYSQIGIKNDDFSQSTPVPLIMPPSFYTKEQSIAVLTEIFETFMKSIIEAKTTSFQFYTRSELSYGLFIPLILLQENPEFIKDQRFVRSYRYIKNILSQKNATLTDENEKIILTYHTQYFLYDLIKLLNSYRMKSLMNEAFSSMVCLMKDIQISSTTIPFYYQYYFSQKLYTDEKSCSIEVFYQNSLFRVNDIIKFIKFYQVFEVFNNFSKEFVEHRGQQQKTIFYKTILVDLMHFISQIFIIPNPQDIIMNSRRKTANVKSDHEFAKNVINLYCNQYEKFRWPFLFFIEKIISTLTFFTGRMSIVKAIKIRDGKNKNMCIEKTISFYDQLSENEAYALSKEKQMTNNQNNSIPQPSTGAPSITVNFNGNSYQQGNTKGKEKENSKYTKNCYMNKINDDIDHLLFSAYECRTYQSYEEAVNAYERLEKIYNIPKRIYISLNLFGYTILQNLLQNLVQNDPTNNPSIISFYFERLFRSIINLIIFSSYRLMLLSTFTKTQQLYKNRYKNQPISRPSEYALNYAKSIGDIISRFKLTHPLLSLIATILADCLFNATKKQVVTSLCVKYIYIIVKSQSSQICNLLVQKMMEILYSNIMMEASYDNSKAVLFQQWLLLIIKIGGKKSSNYPPNTQFAQLLRNYQHTFSSFFFNKINTMNQPEVIISFIKYITSMKSNTNDFSLKQLENPESKTILKFQKYNHINDFNPEYQSEVSTLLLDHAIFDYTDNQVTPYLILQALLSRNLDVTKNAINIFSKYLNNIENNIDNDIDSLPFSYYDFLRPINYLPKDLAIQLFELISKIPPLFSPYSPFVSFTRKGYYINIDPEINDFYKLSKTEGDNEGEETESTGPISIANIEYNQILLAINRYSTRTKTEAKHLLMLISILIESNQVLKFSIYDLQKTLETLFSIARYTDLRNQVELLINKMNTIFAPIIKDSEIFDYVYAFTFSFTVSQSESSQYAIKQFKSFIYGTDMTIYIGTVIADRLLPIIKFPSDILNTLLLFTILVTKRPGCIQLTHFSSLFALLKDQIFFHHMTRVTGDMNIVCQLFKKFLKKFIQSLNNEQKVSFIAYCHSIIKSRSSTNNLFMKLIIIKELPKLNISFDHYDPNFYRNVPDELFYHIMSLIVGCGSKIQLTQELVDHSIKNLTAGDYKTATGQLNRLTFISMLTKAKANIELYTKEDMQNQNLHKIFHFLVNTYTPQYSKTIGKCISWINVKKPEIVRTIIQKDSMTFNEPIATLIKDDKKIRYFQRSQALMYEYIEPNHLLFIFSAISEITKMLKMSSVNTISALLKIMVSYDFQRQDLRNCVLGPSQVNPQNTCIGQFLIDVGKLFSFPLLPIEDFIKFRVVKFLLNFKMETIQFIFNNSNEVEAKHFYDVLYSMITSDETNETFDIFVQSINPVDQFGLQVQMFANHHPMIYEIEKKLSEESKYAQIESFKELVISQFNIFYNRKQNKILTDNDSNQLNSIVATFINILRVCPDFTNLVNLASFFALGSNVYTSLYLKFKADIFTNKEKQFYIDMFQSVLDECSPNFDEETNEIADDSVNLLEVDMTNNFGIYRFTTNSTTAIILSNLIKGISPISIEMTDTKIFNHLLATLRCMLNDQIQRYTAMKCYYALYKNNPRLPFKPTELKNVLSSFQYLLEQSEPYPIILTFKFASKLLNRDQLPEFILSNILQHIFSFQRFIDFPYATIVSSLFIKANQFYTSGKHGQIPEALSSSFKAFLIEKIIVIKELDKIINIMKLFPAIVKTVPFDILSTLIYNFEIRGKSQVSIVFYNFENILKMYSISTDVSKPVQIIFSRIAVKYLQKTMETVEKDQNYQLQLESSNQSLLNNVSMIMKYAKSMPEDVLLTAISKTHHTNPSVARFFQIICILSTEFFDEKLLNNQSSAIIESFENLMKDIKQNIQFARVYIQSIFGRENLSDIFIKRFLDYLDDYTKLPSQLPPINKFETAHHLLIFYAKETKHDKKLPHLESFWNTVDESTIQFMKLWIFNYLDIICELPIDQQKNLFDFIISKLKNSSTPIPFNINVLKSQNVSIKLKQNYLYHLLKIFHTLNYEELYELLKSLEELSSSELYNYIIICHLHLIMKANDEGRLIHIDDFQRILGKSEEERFVSLFNFIPSEMWKNSYLTFIVLIIMNHTKIIKPLIMLADCFEKISSKFAIPLFSRIMNQKTVSMFHKLLTSTLSMKDSENYSEIISSITNTYSLKSSLISNIPKEIKFNKISPNLLYKSIKITNDDFLYFDNLSLNQASKIPDKLLYPHSMNDDIFSLLPCNSSIESLSASAQFFLSNYNESSKIFSAYEHEIFIQDSTAASSPQFSFGNSSSLVDLSVTSMNNNAHTLLNRLMEISNDIVSKEGTFHVFERLNHEDQLIQCLENALNSIFISAPDNAMNEISIATMYNILYFKHHKNPSLYEFQRMISVELVLSLMNQRLSFNTKKLELLNNLQKVPQITQPSLNQNPNMMKKMPQPQMPQQHQIQMPASILRIPSVFIKSIFYPIISSFIEKFEDYLFSNEAISSRSKENQVSNSTLNLNVVLKPNLTTNVFDLSDSATAIFSHEYRSLFDSVIDTNSYGFFSVTMSQVNAATETLLRSINNDKFKQQSGGMNPTGNFFSDAVKPSSTISSVYMKESAEVKWPGFCFSLLTSSSTLSSSLHQAALQGYFNLARKPSVSFFIHESYYARILTLIGLSIVYMDDNLISNSMKFSESIFKEKSLMFQYTKFWGSQVAFLYTHPRFQAQIVELLRPYSSLQQTMNAHNLCKKPFPEQLDIINTMHLLFSLIFDINTSAFDFNDEYEKKTGDCNEIDVEKCAEKCLTYKSIEVDLDTDVKKNINKYINMINQRLPCEFEISIPLKLHSSRIRLYHINNDFTKVDDNIIAFTAMTSNSSHTLFFVEKVQSTDTLMTFANVLYLFKQMLKFSYPTRSRNIRFSAPLPFEIGEGMIMYQFPFDSVAISRFRFCDFVDKEVKNVTNANKHIFPFFMKQHVIESSSFDPKTFIDLRKKLISNFAAYSALRSIFSLDQPPLEQLFISFQNAEFPFILSHFSVPKDYSKTATAIPPILLDFFSEVSNPHEQESEPEPEPEPEAESEPKQEEKHDNEENEENKNDDDDENQSLFGLRNEADENGNDDLLFGLQNEDDHQEEFSSTTTTVAEANNDDDDDNESRSTFGHIVRSSNGFDRKFEMSFAAVHQSLSSYIDTFRAIVEMPIQDSLHTVNRQIDNILAARDLIEASLFDYTPPFSEGASPTDSVEWFKRVQDFVENSKSTYEREKTEQPRAISIPPPSTTLLPTPSRDNFSLTPTPSSGSSIFSTNNQASSSTIGLGLGDDFGSFDMSGITSFGSPEVNVTGIGNNGSLGISSSMSQSGIGGGGLSSTNSLDSFGPRSPMNTVTPNFDTSQEISRNNSLLNFRNNSNETGIGVTGNNQLAAAASPVGIMPSNSFDFNPSFDQNQQMMNLQMIQQNQQQNFLGPRLNSFDSSGMIQFQNPQPLPKVVSPQIQMTPPRQQQQQQPPPMHQLSNDFGNDEPDDSFSMFF